MLKRINVYNLLYDFRDFIKCNYRKLICIGIINVLAIILGIRGGLSIHDAERYLNAHSTNAFLLFANEKSIFGYFFINLITYLAILTLLAIASVHFLVSYCCFLILFLRSYLFALHLCLYIMLLKLSVLPFILFCMVPCYIISMFIYAVVTVCTLHRARDIRIYGHSKSNGFLCYIQKMLIPCIMLVILTILCAILSYFLTLGIIL